MPFGAQLDEEGARFRLWAPAADEVRLVLEGDGRETILPMQPHPGGWHECRTDFARPGVRYQYELPGGQRVPDPTSRFQPGDVHGASELIDSRAYRWNDAMWRGRPWEEAVLYELHVGTFSPEGTFAGVEARLDDLAELGVTAIELMPVADFPGRRNWGYDGVLPFAPDSAYGRPEDLKRLVDAAHARGLMMFLDVVYNHFGPEGNYLHCYAPQFFTERHHTPWGAAINFDGADSRTVRDFFIHNALYWLEEYRLDGLRLDAVHAILDDSRPDILEELAAAVRAGPGQARHVHLVLENDHNAARYLARDRAHRPSWYAAQWNDDLHHVLHVLLTGEQDGYYADYAQAPARLLGRCLAEGFAYQGEPSPYRDGAPRGEPTRGLPPMAFVNLLQNHDQVGNRAFGERLGALAEPAALRAATAILLLAPAVPMLFMGEEWNAPEPFPFFCDFGPELAAAVTAGRRREFARFPAFRDPAARARIPDPGDAATFSRARLDWSAREQPAHAEWRSWVGRLLALRREAIVPRLAGMPADAARHAPLGARAVQVAWQLNDGSHLTLLANLAPEAVVTASPPAGACLFAWPAVPRTDTLPPWSVAWYLDGG
jgi:maltooligosyltrehalose trehalohydrolase